MSELSFHFDPQTLEIATLGQKYDGRRFLRNLEAELRGRTGLPQVTARFMLHPMAASSITVEHHERTGYDVAFYPFALMDPKHADECREYAAEWIESHARKHGIRPGLPPINGTVVRIVETVNLDTSAHQYLALGHDGGAFLAFYKERRSGRYFMLKQVDGVGVVHTELDSSSCRAVMEGTQRSSSAFLHVDESSGAIEQLITDFVRAQGL